MLTTMWKLLSALPPNLIEVIFLTFTPNSVAELEGFAWLETHCTFAEDVLEFDHPGGRIWLVC